MTIAVSVQPSVVHTCTSHCDDAHHRRHGVRVKQGSENIFAVHLRSPTYSPDSLTSAHCLDEREPTRGSERESRKEKGLTRTRASATTLGGLWRRLVLRNGGPKA